MDPGTGLSRLQLLAYVALGVVLLLLGLKALGVGAAGGSGEAGDQNGSLRVAAEPVGSGGEGAAAGDLVVHVAGAVREPGVYRLPAGSRVTQAIERAGGPRPGAAPDGINLAARLADGQQVVVPARSPGATSGAAAEDGPISLGSADAAALEEIDGIGPITAAKILEFRDENGGIGAIEELDEVPGIGPATIESLSDRLQP